MMKSKIAVAVMAALAFGSAYGQSTDSTDQATSSAKAKRLDAVTVTGSLIPQTAIETATPITTITAQDIKAKGFATVAEALQQSSFATGSVQGPQDTNSFTPGAKTLSLFGLSVSFTKYLIDSRPMGNFPGLYNGSSAFNSISGIPVDMVDHIDILPGGQSSLYGSDAIAGVVNIVLKKHIDAPSMDVRYGWYKNGGGSNRRISLADSFSVGKFNSLVGVQFENSQPIYTRDRDLTKTFYGEGTTAPIAARDYLFLGAFDGYHFDGADNCSRVGGEYGGTVKQYHRTPQGDYCGSLYSPGYATLNNDDKTVNLYTHNTFDVSDNMQLYGDLLYNYEEQKYSTGNGTNFWTTSKGNSPTENYFWDPNLKDLILLQHTFAPEELGGYTRKASKQIENSYMLSLGAKGTLGQSNWDYDLGFMHSDDKTRNRDLVFFTDAKNKFFQDNVTGPQHGTYYGYPVFTPDYKNFYTPLTPAQYDSISGYTESQAKTWDNLFRLQMTNTALFNLGAGDAGVAAVLEGGNEGWASEPDPRLLIPGYTNSSATPGGAHRTRYAATTEFRVPLLSQLTLDASGRFDSYKTQGSTVHHGTYNIGLEYRPFDMLLLRGRYGTAFKVPTLADTNQGVSGFYNYVEDYANCGREGHGGVDIAQCSDKYKSVQYHGTTYGVLGLKPITAKVWSYGFVFSPLDNLHVNVDYYHYDINNEVNPQNADQLSRTEYLCDIGTTDPTSPTCLNAFAQIQRGPASGGFLGGINEIIQPKLNQANEVVNAVTTDFGYLQDIGSFGKLSFDASYSNVLKHTTQAFPGDENIDVLRHPGYSTDFRTKANASVTWLRNEWTATVYVNRYGRTPNNLAYSNDTYDLPGAGKVGAWIVYNASVTYNPTKSLGLSLLVNNVFNKMPPPDHSYDGFTTIPYDTTNYNAYGRAMFVEANYKFGLGG
jgi:outer membrane receptor protein involved in Fe transport